MAFKVYDYLCPNCGALDTNVVVEDIDEDVFCEKCSTRMSRQHPAPTSPTATIPDYPGSQRHKAGYAHKYVNRPAEKTQVGYGGSVSSDHPTGGGKAQS